MLMVSRLPDDALRAVMRNVPSPVTVVTYAGFDGPRGVTIGSFTSVSLAPPLVSFNLMLNSQTHDDLLGVDHFLVQILSADQAFIGERFAHPELSSTAQFDGIPHRTDEYGIPWLEGILATVFCRPFETMPAGDHTLVLGEVLEATMHRAGRPLVYYQNAYREVGDVVDLAMRSEETA